MDRRGARRPGSGGFGRSTSDGLLAIEAVPLLVTTAGARPAVVAVSSGVGLRAA